MLWAYFLIGSVQWANCIIIISIIGQFNAFVVVLELLISSRIVWFEKVVYLNRVFLNVRSSQMFFRENFELHDIINSVKRMKLIFTRDFWVIFLFKIR